MTPTTVPSQVTELSAALSRPKPMRRGSLNERYMKCGQAGCACQQDAQARHGPYYTLTQAAEGRTRSRYLRAEDLPEVRQQIAAGWEFRRQVESYWEACERWADASLESPPAAAEAAEKKGSGRRSRTKSARRSKRS